MESILAKLQPPASGSGGERRHRIRHKLHTPVYASFGGQSSGLVLDVNELLDLSEDGFAVQAGEHLELNQPITFSLDLPETKAHVHGAGRVVWTDRAGRGGIEFAGMTDTSRRAVKEWLLVNLLVAARVQAVVRARNSTPAERVESIAPPSPPQPVLVPPVPEPSEVLSAVEAIRREMRSAADADAAFHLITERALSLTGAGGAALAFSTHDRMECRASAGSPAMPIGAGVDVKSGLTGECVRSGRMVACADTETDSRVDRELCRMLDIRSILAAPIVSDFRVVGLLEVFSPQPGAFTQVHETALDRLVDLVPKPQPVPALVPQPVKAAAAPPAEIVVPFAGPREEVWEQETEAQEPLGGVPVRLTHIVLLGLTLAVVCLVAGYLSAPQIEAWMNRTSKAAAPFVPPAAPVKRATKSTPLDELRKLAEQGDAYAQYLLGSRDHIGEGVPEDDAQAMRWYERAANQGYVDAQAAAGAYYWAGRGVPKDLTRAYFWSTLALHQGDTSMESRLQGLALQMTAAQVAMAQQQADDWMGHRGSAATK